MAMKMKDYWVPSLFNHMPEGDVININGRYATVRMPSGQNLVVKVDSIARRLKASERGKGNTGTIITWYHDGKEDLAVVRSDKLNMGRPEYLIMPESWFEELPELTAIEGR